MSKFIAKTPSLVVINIRSSRETVVIIPTVSVKERGTEWSECIRTHTAIQGRGPDLKTAMDAMWQKWENLCSENYGESVFVEQGSKEWVTLTQ